MLRNLTIMELEGILFLGLHMGKKLVIDFVFLLKNVTMYRDFNL